MAASKETPWSIVVGVAAFLSQVMLGGLVGTSGLYYPHFQNAFQSSGAATSWLCSMTFVGFFAGNSVGSLIVNRVGYRLAAIIGGLMGAIGLSLCLIASNFYMLFLFYGVLACIGNGIYAIAFLVAIIAYFDKHRRSVQVLITVGSGVGFATYSVMIPYLMRQVGWRGCIFLQGGMSLNVCVLAMLLFKRENLYNKPRKFSINLSVFFKLPIVLFCFHAFFGNMAETGTFVHLPVLVISKGFSESGASMTFLSYALCNVIGKLTYSLPLKIDPIILYTVTILTYGATALCQPFLTGVIPICIASGVAGFAGNCFAGYTTVVLLELAGTDLYTDVHGIAYLFRAAGSITSGPISGYLYDVTHRYENVFFMIAGLIAVSCVLMVPIIARRRCITDKSIVIEHEIQSEKGLVKKERKNCNDAINHNCVIQVS